MADLPDDQFTPPKRIAICGGGIVGTCIAYFLAEKDPTLQITIIERSALACAASGKAGGFLALNWCDGNSLETLAHKSFQLHFELAKQFNGDVKYGYRQLDTIAVTASTKSRYIHTQRSLKSATATISKQSSHVPWLDPIVVHQTSVMGTTTTTAQLYPYHFVHTLFEHASERGVELKIGTVEGITYDDEDRKKATGVIVDGEVLEADAVIIAMGPWSGAASEWVGHTVPISGSRAHSIILQPHHPVTPHALFVSIFDGRKSSEPEVYPRPDGTVYLCGEGDSAPPHQDPNQIHPRKEAIVRLQELAGLLSPSLKEAPLLRQQACFLPISYDGIPLIGKCPGLKGVYLATGHSCWGILLAPGTGLVMAELVLEGKSTSVDISAFDPLRMVE